MNELILIQSYEWNETIIRKVYWIGKDNLGNKFLLRVQMLEDYPEKVKIWRLLSGIQN